MAPHPITTFGKRCDLSRGKHTLHEASLHNRNLRRVAPTFQELSNPAWTNARSVEQRHQIECVSRHNHIFPLTLSSLRQVFSQARPKIFLAPA